MRASKIEKIQKLLPLEAKVYEAILTLHQKFLMESDD